MSLFNYNTPFPLICGQEYRLRVSGSFSYWATMKNVLDAAYNSVTPPPTPSGNLVKPPYSNRPIVDVFNPAHIYEYCIIGQGVPLNIYFKDSNYPDNSGKLTYELFAMPTNLNFLWDFAGQGASTTPNPSFTFNNAGTDTVSLTVTNQTCPTDTYVCTYNAIHNITIFSSPILITSTNLICSNQCTGTAAATPSCGSAPFTYNWSNTQTSQTTTGLCAGTYIITVTDAAGSTVAQTVAITSPPALPVTASVNSNTIAPGDSAQLTATGGVIYSWYPSAGLNDPTISNPLASPAQTTTYCVTVTDTNSCYNSDCITINVDNPCGTLFIPNAFSPNGDGENDILKIYIENNCITNFHLVIFDRWGENVFESYIPQTGWDGTYRGKWLDPAVFVYYLKATFTSGEKINKKGNISLMR
ncbi:MAG: gliding motility-associated C-terminal domain-containing protein [Bacteroidetes bacterium]|nr:gliding motility-associated C-terminal domain-containing protein [Bacteroidota bacterium]